MTRHLSSLLLLAALPIVPACSSGSSGSGTADTSPDPTTSAEVRALHASPDAPAVNVLADGIVVIDGLSFGEGSRTLFLEPGLYSVEIQGLLPSGPTRVFGPVDLNFSSDTDYTIVATGDVGSPTGLTPVVLERDDIDIDDDFFRVKIFHAAPRAGSVDIYVTEPNADLTASTPLATLDFGGQFGPRLFPEGDYRIRVTPAGRNDQVVFDSGSIELDGDDDYVVAAVENRGAGRSPIRIVVLDDDLDDEIEIVDGDEEGVLRIVHAVPDVDEVDVLVNGLSAPLVEDLDFGDDEDDIVLPPGTYDVQVTLANQPSVVAIDTQLTIEAGRFYTVAAVGILATNSVRPLVVEQERRRIATEARITLIHAAPSAGTVDIWVIPDDANLADFEPTLTNVDFEAVATLVVPEDDYELIITAPGSTVPVLGPVDIDIDDDEIYTAIVRDADGTGGPFGLILLDDFGD